MPNRKRTPALATAKSGTPITNDIADELAHEAERGYDLRQARRVGRPSLGATGKSPRLNFRVTSTLYEHTAERAEREGKTVSEIAREALTQYVK